MLPEEKTNHQSYLAVKLAKYNSDLQGKTFPTGVTMG